MLATENKNYFQNFYVLLSFPENFCETKYFHYDFTYKNNFKCSSFLVVSGQATLNNLNVMGNLNVNGTTTIFDTVINNT